MASPFPWKPFTLRTVCVLGPSLFAWLLAGLAGVVGLPRGVEDALPLAAGVLLVIALSALCRSWAADGAIALIALCALLATIAIFAATPITALAQRGHETTATVVAEEHVTWHGRGGTQHEWHYRLADMTIGALHGQLVETTDRLDVGDRVQVIYDPAGLADPHTPSEVDQPLPYWEFFGVSAGLTVLGALAISAWSLSERRARREEARRLRPGGRTWFRPLGGRRRIIGRSWFALGLAMSMGGAWSMIVYSGTMGALGVMLVVTGFFVALLSLAPAFGRDNRTK